MRKRARTDLSGGRSVMSVPTGTLVGDQVNGALFEAGNVEELSRKLVHL
jgi:hypothetical protein